MKLDDSLGFILNNAGRKTSQLLSMRFHPYGITTEQWTVLTRLAEKDGISQKELALWTEKDQTNITRILDQLERKELIKRKPNAKDRRSLLIFITDKGRVLNEKLLPIEEEVINSFLDGLSEEHISIFTKILKHITNNANIHIKRMER